MTTNGFVSLHILLVSLFPLVISDLRIGAFNVQTFGRAKYSNETLRNHLVEIVIKYDLILIQEIRDSSETAIFSFLSDCATRRPSLKMIVSPRLGRTSYKEQYAVIYDRDKLTVMKYTVFNNPRDLFARPPITVHFLPSVSLPEFTLLGVHVDPDDVVQELDEVPAAWDYALSLGYPSRGFLLGDLNADCSYLSEKEFSNLQVTSDPNFTWLGDTHLDTTVSMTTECYYDRVVVCGEGLRGDALSPLAVDLFDTHMSNDLAKRISDHYPVYFHWQVAGEGDAGGNGPDGADTSQAISHFTNIFSDLLCSLFPSLNEHKDKEWLESAVLFLTFVAILACRRVIGYFNLIIA